MVEITYQMLLSTIQTVSLVVGITYSILALNYTRKNQKISLRNQEQTLKTRSASIFHQTYGSLITSPEGLKNIQIIQENRISSYDEHMELARKNSEYQKAWYWCSIIYEQCGIYIKEGVLDIGMMAQHMPYWALRFWRQSKDIIYEHRKRLGPSYYRNLEYFMESLQKYFEEHPELAP
jgi:hypothetical protein